jgi:hypothetical protein
VTSSKPSAHDAHQQTQAQPEINRGVKRPVTSIAPPANKARLNLDPWIETVIDLGPDS